MKKVYSKLSMRVFQLQTANCLLQGSSVSAVRGNVDFEYGHGSNGSARTRENDSWDEEW